MTKLPNFISLACSCDQALIRLRQNLEAADLRVVQTFDLQSARFRQEDCPCPHHGTNVCNCQMVVVLIYGKVDEPATLILHGNEGRTWLSLVDRPGQRSGAGALSAIQMALESESVLEPRPNGLCWCA